MDRLTMLSDVGRAASLQDIHLEVAVAHTRNRLRARFCVAMRRPRPHAAHWAVGVDIRQVKHFEKQLVALAKSHHGRKCSCTAAPLQSSSPSPSSSSVHCAMCLHVRQELQKWPRFPVFSTLGKHRLDAKCAKLTQFFDQLFQLLALNARSLPSCELLREILQLTETLCCIKYEDDSTAIRVIRSLKRVDDEDRAHGTSNQDEDREDHEDDDCSICLSSLYDLTEPEEHADKTSNENQSLQTVELPCGHRFHDTCVCVWFHTRLTCPVCRQDSTRAAPNDQPTTDPNKVPNAA